MYLRDKISGDLVEVMDVPDMMNPCVPGLKARFHAGEELQETTLFAKNDLEFPSGETLPRCWVDAEYRAVMH